MAIKIQHCCAQYVLINSCICWESSTESCRQSRRLLEGIKDKFLIQVIDSPTVYTVYSMYMFPVYIRGI